MTDPAQHQTAVGVQDSVELQATIYSKDYWDLVFEQLGKRPLFKLGMAVLALLYGAAIYAPFLANDRPFVIEAVDLKGYRSAISSLSPVTTGMASLMKMTDEQYTERLRVAGTLGREGVPTDRGSALKLEEAAADQRLGLIRRALPLADRSRLDPYELPMRSALQAFARGEWAVALESVAEAKTVARAFRRELAAWDPRVPEKSGIHLVGHRRWPLFEALSAKEVFFMVLWFFVLTWPVWNGLLNRRVLGGERERIRRWRRRKAFGVAGISLASALLWMATPLYGEAGSFDTAPFKGALADGDMWLVPAGELIGAEMAETVTWTPVVFGTAETHSDAETNFRPPTWSSHSAIDEAGRYESGPRKRAEDRQDPTGYEVPAVPVEIRPGEPPLNHPLRRIAGTDELGRDFFTRILWGGRVSLMVGILSAVLLTVIGVVVGSIAGYFGGRVDIAIMRLIEIIQSLPAFFLILMAMAFTDPKVVPPIVAIVVVIALIRWTGTARLVRGEFLRLREQEFVLAAKALGFSDARTIFRHVLPNALSPVLVSAAFAVAAGILTESAISFLGFGTRPPEASWGALVNESRNPEFWWIQVFPGVLIFITVTCYNLVGEAIRDALDPKMKL